MMLHLVLLSHSVEQELVHPTSLQGVKIKSATKKWNGKGSAVPNAAPGSPLHQLPLLPSPTPPSLRVSSPASSVVVPLQPGASPASLPPSLP